METYFHGFPEVFRVFTEINDYLTKNMYTEPDVVMNHLLTLVVPMVQAAAGTIRLYDEPTDNLVLRAGYNISQDHRSTKRQMPMGKSLVGLAFQKGQVIFSEDLQQERQYIHPEYVLRTGLRSVVSAPLKTPERRMGVMSLYYSRKHRFSPPEREFFTAFSSFISGYVATYLLHHQLLRSYLDTTKALIMTLEERDGFSSGHSARVRYTAVKIAKAMGLSEEKIQLLSEVSVLHDIGKMVIDKVILDKPGKLSEQEWDVIKNHPVVGSRMLSPLKALSPVFPLIKYHHERMDGSGYPDGLTGSKIPLMARILAVADAFDAMTSERPYRKALTLDMAVKELKANAGRQFDAEIVDVVLKLLDTGEISL